MKKVRKVFTLVFAMALALGFCLSPKVNAAEEYVVFRDGAFQNGAFANDGAGAVTDGVIVGPGWWTQINAGNDTIGNELPYLVITVKCPQDSPEATINISDLGAKSFAEAGGVSLNTEYQTAVFNIAEFGDMAAGWLNFQGVEGEAGYTISEIYFTDEAPAAAPAADTDKAAADTDKASLEETKEAAPAADTSAPKTGSSSMPIVIAASCLILAGGFLTASRKMKAENK